MKRQRLSRMASCMIMMALGVLLLIAPASAGAQGGPFGAIQGRGHHVIHKKHARARVIAISNARAQFLAMKFAKGRISPLMTTQHMKRRVQNPLPLKARKAFAPIYYTGSSNWSGYTADTSWSGTYVNAVGGAFNVSPENGTVTASWVGIGGFYSDSLIQTGVDQYYDATWVELLPDYPVYLYYVNPGDSMYGEVALDYYTGYWYVLIWDMTTGNYYANEYSYAADQSTADWIVEVQPYGSVPYFDPVNFNTAQWEDSYGYVQDMTSNEASVDWNITLYSPVSGAVCASYPTSSQSFTAYVC